MVEGVVPAMRPAELSRLTVQLAALLSASCHVSHFKRVFSCVSADLWLLEPDPVGR